MSVWLNPIGISARFELVECYFMSKQLSFARKSLYEMKDFLHDDRLQLSFTVESAILLLKKAHSKKHMRVISIV